MTDEAYFDGFDEGRYEEEVRQRWGDSPLVAESQVKWPSFLRGLADMWVQDPRFAINYERIREGGAAVVREAVHRFCDANPLG